MFVSLSTQPICALSCCKVDSCVCSFSDYMFFVINLCDVVPNDGREHISPVFNVMIYKKCM